jgi:hypothetical protein
VIYFVRSYSIPDSVDGAVSAKAREMSKKIVKYVREKWPERDCRLTQNMTGDPSRIHFTTAFKSLAEVEQWWKMYWEDSGVKSILAEWTAAGKELDSPLIVEQSISYYRDME